MENSSHLQRVVTLVLIVLTGPFLLSSLWAQVLPQSPYSAANVLRESGLDLVPSNPLGMPGTTGGLPRGSDSIYLSDQILRGILGPIPNLQVGYLYRFGNSLNSGRLTLDYLLPIEFGKSAVFGEAHTEFQGLWKTVSVGAFNSVDLSLGGGYRTILNDTILLGVNGFVVPQRACPRK